MSTSLAKQHKTFDWVSFFSASGIRKSNLEKEIAAQFVFCP